MVNAGLHTTTYTLGELFEMNRSDWRSGKYKQMGDNGERILDIPRKYALRVVAFNHNKEYETNNKNSITLAISGGINGDTKDYFWIENLYYPANYQGSWENSYIMKVVFPDLLENVLPLDWVNVMGVTRKTNATGKLFVPTIYEISGLTNDRQVSNKYQSANQVPYEYYKDNNVRKNMTLERKDAMASQIFWGTSTWNQEHVAIYPTDNDWGSTANNMPGVVYGYQQQDCCGCFPLFNIIAD